MNGYYLYWSHVLVYMRVGVYVSYKFVPPNPSSLSTTKSLMVVSVA